MLEVLGLIVDTAVGVATIWSLWYLGKQVKLERAADERNARDQAEAEEERINNQIRLLCVNWSSARVKSSLHSADKEESQGIRISNYSNTVFRDFVLNAWYVKREEVKVTRGRGAYYVSTDNKTFEPTKNTQIATHRQGVNQNIYLFELKASTSHLRPGDFYVSTKRGIAVKDEMDNEVVDPRGFNNFPEFVEVEQLKDQGIFLSTPEAIESEDINSDANCAHHQSRFRFKASCFDIRGNKWEIDSATREWRQVRK